MTAFSKAEGERRPDRQPTKIRDQIMAKILCKSFYIWCQWSTCSSARVLKKIGTELSAKSFRRSFFVPSLARTSQLPSFLLSVFSFSSDCPCSFLSRFLIRQGGLHVRKGYPKLIIPCSQGCGIRLQFFYPSSCFIVVLSLFVTARLRQNTNIPILAMYQTYIWNIDHRTWKICPPSSHLGNCSSLIKNGICRPP